MMGAAVLSVLSVLVFSRLLGTHSPARVVPAAIVASQLSLLAAWGLSFAAPRLSALAVYAHVAVFGGALVSGSWSLVNERFDPRTGKRVVGSITTGGLTGAVIGALLAWGAARLIPVPAMLLLMVAINGLALAGVIVVGRSTPASAASARPEESPASGFRTLRETAYLRRLAIVVGLSALTEALLDYVLNAEAEAAYASGSELMSFFALFYMGVAGVGLVLQLTVAERILVAGLVRSISLKPASVLLGGALGAVAPGLWTAAAIRGIPAVFHNSIYRSGYELLFTPLPERQKRPAKALIDVGMDKLGAFLGGGTALLVVAVAPELAPRALCLLAAVVGGVVMLACRGLQSGYVGTLEANLRSRAISVEPSQIHDSATRLTVARVSASGGAPGAEAPPALELDTPLLRRIAALRSSSARIVREELRELLDPNLVSHAIEVLERDELSREAVAALRGVAPRAIGQLCDVLVDPERPSRVRRRVPRILKVCADQRSADGLCLGLQDARFDVRYECGVALARIAEREPGIRVDEGLVTEAVVRELRHDELGEKLLKHTFNLLSVVRPREPLRLCYQALHSEDAVRGTALEYLEHMLPDAVRRALVPLLERSGRSRPGAGPGPRSGSGASRRSQQELLRDLSQTSSASGAVPAEDEEDEDPDGDEGASDEEPRQ
jgi:hypothetical protein